MKLFLLQLSKRRSPLFWGVTLASTIFGIWILSKILFSYIPETAKSLTPRIPLVNSNKKISLEVYWNMQEFPEQKRNQFVIGTPIYQLQPELSLVGFIENVDKPNEDVWRFHLQIFPQNEALLRDDTKFEVFHTSPTLLAIWSRFLNKDRSEQLKQQMTVLAKRNQPKVQSIFAQLAQDLGDRLKDKDLGERIFQDEKVQSLVLETLKMEVFSKIDSDKVFESLEKSPETAELKNIFKDNIRWRSVLTGSLGKSIEGGVDGASSLLFDPEFLPKNKTGNFMKVTAGAIYILLNPQKAMKKIADKSLEGAGEGAWQVTLHEMKRVFKEHDEEVSQHGSKLLKDTAQEIQLTDKLNVGFQALIHNQELREYIENRYGSNAWGALTATFDHAIKDETIRGRLSEIAQETQTLLADWAGKFILNDNQTGPNPLLLMALKQNISGSAEPQIVCHPGVGLIVAEKHIYKIRQEQGANN